MKRLMIALMSAAILSGCAMNREIVLNGGKENVAQKNISATTYNLLLEPVDTVGFLETQSLLEKKTTFYEVVFPEILALGEFQKDRLKWYGLCIDDNGHEFLVQLIWTPRIRLSGHMIGVISVEGDVEKMINPKVLGFSTKLKFAYSLDEKEVETLISEEKLLDDPVYRKELVSKYGTPISKFKKADYMYSYLNGWNRFAGPRGHILTPAQDSKRFFEIARKNPAYSVSQKEAENFVFSLSIDPIATGVANFSSFLEASFAPSQGWDFDNRDARATALVGRYLMKMKTDGMLRMFEKILDEKKTVRR